MNKTKKRNREKPVRSSRMKTPCNLNDKGMVL